MRPPHVVPRQHLLGNQRRKRGERDGQPFEQVDELGAANDLALDARGGEEQVKDHALASGPG